MRIWEPGSSLRVSVNSLLSKAPGAPWGEVGDGGHALTVAGLSGQPGGHVIGRPPSTCACACATVWPPSRPVLKTIR